MRLSLQMDPDRWLLARLHTDELREILANLDVGRNGVVVVSDAEGRLLVHSLRSDTLTGRQMAPAAPDLLPGQVLPLGTDLSAVDGVRRVAATAVSADYPLRIYAGVDHAQMLRPWWPFLAGSALVYLLYWAGFFYLRRNVRRAEYRQARLEAELRVGDDELRLAHQVGGIGTWSIDGHRQR
ncbi:sensor domain-containing phosphodiesterase, partial [Xanthomonas sp. Kuri4-1]